jgi:hypothetical protein
MTEKEFGNCLSLQHLCFQLQKRKKNSRFSKSTMMVSSKVDFVPFCHSVLDTESSEFSHLWIPAFAGMTVLDF